MAFPAVVRSPFPLNRWHALTGPGLSAARRFWRPIVLLQLAALVLVVAYGRVAAVTAACDRLSDLKRDAGLAASAVAAAVAGAVLPEVAKATVMGERRLTRRRARDVAFAAGLFAVNGLVTDLRYRGLAAALGHDASLGTAVRKMLVDQFLVTPLYTTPYWRLAYAWRADRYRPGVTLGRLSPAWYRRSVAPLLVTGWAFWVPMTLLVFSLPTGLQFELFVLAGGAWSLLMVAVADDRDGPVDLAGVPTPSRRSAPLPVAASWRPAGTTVARRAA